MHWRIYAALGGDDFKAITDSDTILRAIFTFSENCLLLHNDCAACDEKKQDLCVKCKGKKYWTGKECKGKRMPTTMYVLCQR